MKKVRRTTRSFRYDLNQTPYDYTVEVRNRFKGLDLIECLKKEMQERKMASWGGLTNNCEKKRSERKRRKGKIFPFECRVPKNSKER